jgi:hypothetical protein
VVAEERRMAERDLFRTVARETGQTEDSLRAEYEVIAATTSANFVDTHMELLSLKRRAA